MHDEDCKHLRKQVNQILGAHYCFTLQLNASWLSL